MFDGNLLEYGNDLGEEWVGNFGDDQAEDLASAGHQRSGLSIGKITSFIDYLQHAFGQSRVHRRRPIDDARNGSGGNSCPSRDFAEVHILDIGSVSFVGRPGRHAIKHGTMRWNPYSYGVGRAQILVLP
jgi:hypothetical protein